jgi:hypothetical protein
MKQCDYRDALARSTSNVNDYIRYNSDTCLRSNPVVNVTFNISFRIYLAPAPILGEGILRLQSLDDTPSDRSGSGDYEEARARSLAKSDRK